MMSDEAYMLKRYPERAPVRNVSFTAAPSAESGEEEKLQEKPWQRVPAAVMLLVLGAYLLLGYLTHLLEEAMPTPVHEADVPPDNSEIFSEEAALKYLDQILGSEPRVAGTQYHLAKTLEMKAILDAIVRQSSLPVHTDWQLAYGDYWLEFSSPHVNCYQNLSNVVAVLEGEAGFHANGTAGTSLLLNCHYDSVPFALGASDDGVFCAVMMETLSKLSRRKKPFKHNIVFLFNGAEENPLQASHAFLSHPWSLGVTNVINLEAAGMNGKPNVFQVTDPRLLATYARRAHRPSAQALGQFLFDSGAVPSDTDFRIWRDFGDIHGLDIAFVKWGVVYHTRYDHPALLRPGVVQGAGDMLLALTTELADATPLRHKVLPTSMVYYDYVTLFLVYYPAGAAVAVDSLAALAGLLSVGYYLRLVGFRATSVRALGVAAAARLVCPLAGAALAAAGALLAIAAGMQMRYLSEPWLVVPLYWGPYLLGAVCAAHGLDACQTKTSGLSRCTRALQAMAATRLLVSVLLLLLLLLSCFRPLGAVRYLLSVPLLLMSASACICIMLQQHLRLRPWQQLVVQAALTVPSVAFLMSLALRLNALLLPTLGRSVLAAPDLLAAAANVAIAALVAAPASGLELLCSRRGLGLPAALLGAVCLLATLVPLSPYRDEGPATQRHHWFHTEIVSYDERGTVTERTTGVLVTPHDAYTIESTLTELRRAGVDVATRRDFRLECEHSVYCNLPLYRLRFGRSLPDSLLLLMAGPAPLQPAPALRITSRSCSGGLCTLHFVMSGPAHNTLTVWPQPGVNLTSWSLQSPLRHTDLLHGRPVYVVMHSTATYSEAPEPLRFALTFTVPESLTGAPLADVSHHAHLIAHPERHTAAFRALMDAMPRYVNIASYVSIRSNYVV